MKLSLLLGILLTSIYSTSYGITKAMFLMTVQVGTAAESASSFSFNPSAASETYDSHASAIKSNVGKFKSGLNDQALLSKADTLKSYNDVGTCALGHIRTNDTAVCAGNVTELRSKPALTYQWSPGNGLNDSTIQNPWVIVDSTRTFYLHTTGYASNLIINPDFELGNTGFTTDYTYCNTDNCLWTMGDYGYSVGTDAAFFLNTYFTGHDHTTGSGNFMMINGGRASLKVWKQTTAVTSNTTYTLSLWISRMNNYDTAQIRLSINGFPLGATVYPPVATNKWEQVTRTWNSGSSVSATLDITDLRTSALGNDFGIDDIVFGELVSCTDSVTITVSKKVSLGQDTVISPGQQLLLTAAGGPFAHYAWNTADTTRTNTITEAGKYWLQVSDPIGCVSGDTILVRSDDSFVVFPNAFTPDNDGHNDSFRPLLNNVVSYHLAIFNRWGQIVFETGNPETGWDGKRAGNACSGGMYIYVATYTFRYQHETKSARGSFMLIR